MKTEHDKTFQRTVRKLRFLTFAEPQRQA